MSSRTAALTQATEERTSGGPGLRGGERDHQPQLDGIRGLAILAVLLSHAVWIIKAFPERRLAFRLTQVMSPGWGGVDLFFALSGFLITGILLRGRHRDAYFKPFYARRVLRIFPIYYLFLFGSLLIGSIPSVAAHLVASDAHLPFTATQRLSFFLYLQNVPVFWPTLAGGLTGLWGAFWSLAVEEQFYLIWPALVRYVRLPWLYWFSVAAVAAGPVVRLLLARRTGFQLGLLQNPVTRLDGLFAGAALALYRERRGRPLSLPWAAAWGTLGASILTMVVVHDSRELVFPNARMDTLGVSAFALLGLALLAASQHAVPGLESFLKASPLRLLGKYSYGIYVYHLSIFFGFHRMRNHLDPVITGRFGLLAGCALDLAAIVCSVLVAALSYRYIEAPFLAMKRWFPSPAAPAPAPLQAQPALPREPAFVNA